MWDTQSASHRLAWSTSHHLARPGPTAAALLRVLSARLPVSAPPTGLDECLFFISLVSDVLVVQFSVSSGCARRHSVSTYAAILVFLKHSSYHLIFQCPLSLVSDLHICWNTIGCSLCSSDQLGVSLVLRGSASYSPKNTVPDY